MPETDIRLSLSICGTQYRAKGFQPFISIKAPFLLDYSAVPGMLRCPYYFEITTTNTFSQYTMVVSRVLPCDASDPNVFKISISTPKGYRIAGGITPYDILMEIYQIFKSRYMRPTVGVEGVQTFKPDMVETSGFYPLILKYKLEPANMPHRVMAGSEQGLVVLPESRISAMMADVMYPEFENFKSVVVASNPDEALCPCKVIHNLEVPRKPKYTLLVNGAPTRWPVADIYNEVTTLRTNENRLIFDNATVEFTVNRLLSGERIAGVVVDNLRETVMVTLQALPKTRLITVVVEGCQNPALELSKLRFSLTMPQMRVVGTPPVPLTLYSGKLKLVGEQLSGKINVSYSGDEYILSNQREAGDHIYVTLKRKQMPKVPTVNQWPGFQKAAQVDNVDPNAVVARVKIPKSCKSLLADSATLEVSSARTKKYSGFPAKFTDSPIDPNSLEMMVTLTSDWAGDSLTFTLRSGKYSCFSNPKILELGSVTAVSLPGLTLAKAENRSNKLLIAALALFLVGLVIGCICFFMSGDKAKEAEDVAVAAGAVKDTVTAPTPEELITTWSIKAQSDSLSFAEIQDFYRKLTTPEMKQYLKEHPNVQPDFDKLETYKQVADAVLNRDADAVKTLAASSDLTLFHQNALIEVFKGYYDDASSTYFDYQADQLDKVRAEFEDTKNQYPDFISLRQLHIGKRANLREGQSVTLTDPQADANKDTKSSNKANTNPSNKANTSKSEAKPDTKQKPTTGNGADLRPGEQPL